MHKAMHPEYTNKNKFTFGVWNAHSVRHKEEIIKDYMTEHDLDFYLIMESFLWPNETDCIEKMKPNKTYEIHESPRPNRKTGSGGGLLCIYKSNVNITKLKPKVKTIAAEYMDLRLTTKNNKTRIVMIYLAPDVPKKALYEDMENIMSYYSTIKEEVIFCGDYNVYVNDPNNSTAKIFLNIIDAANLTQHIKEPTHDKGNTLDLVITRETTVLSEAKVDEMLSDHCNILIKLNLVKPPKIKKVINFRKLNQVDIDKLKEEVKSNLNKIDNSLSLNELVDSFNLVLI